MIGFQKGFVPPNQLLLQELYKLVELNCKSVKLPADYASMLNISERRLNRILMRNKNITLHALIRDRIYKEVIKLIREMDMSIKEISFELGVLGPYYFLGI